MYWKMLDKKWENAWLLVKGGQGTSQNKVHS